MFYWRLVSHIYGIGISARPPDLRHRQRSRAFGRVCRPLRPPGRYGISEGRNSDRIYYGAFDDAAHLATLIDRPESGGGNYSVGEGSARITVSRRKL